MKFNVEDDNNISNWINEDSHHNQMQGTSHYNTYKSHSNTSQNYNNLNKSQSDVDLKMVGGQKVKPQSFTANNGQQKGLKRAHSNKNFYELSSAKSFCEQVDNTQLHPEYKESFKEVHAVMLEQVHKHINELEAVKEDKADTEKSLSKVTSELDWIKTRYQTQKEELITLACELERTKETSRVRLEEAAANEKRMHENESKLFTIQVEVAELKDDTAKLKKNNATLTVEKMLAEDKASSSQYTINNLKKALDLRNDDLAAKLLKYDELFDRCEKGNKAMAELAEKAGLFYETLNTRQAEYLVKFKQVNDQVSSIVGHMDLVNQKLQRVMNNDLPKIDSSLQEMTRIVRDDLGAEIEATTSKRVELQTQHGEMNSAFASLDRDFKAHYAKITKDVKSITTLSKSNVEELTILISGYAGMAFFVGIILTAIFFMYSKS